MVIIQTSMGFTEESATIDYVRLSLREQWPKPGPICGVIPQICVLYHDHIATHFSQPGPKSCSLALVLIMYNAVIVVGAMFPDPLMAVSSPIITTPSGPGHAHRTRSPTLCFIQSRVPSREQSSTTIISFSTSDSDSTTLFSINGRSRTSLWTGTTMDNFNSTLLLDVRPLKRHYSILMN
jgi:hypothetical protein